MPGLLCLLFTISLSLQTVSAGSCVKKLAPALCNDKGLQTCTKEQDSAGCATGEYCYPKTNPDNCPLDCPPICKEHEQYCQGIRIDGAKCPTKDTCIDRTGPAPFNCPRYCAITCPKGEKQCDGVRTKDNPCIPSPFCLPKDDPCPKQTIDEKGCKILDPNAKPPTCTAPQILCDDGWDSSGCKKPPVCKDPLPAKNKKCQPKCPAPCHQGVEQPCQVTYDINGCPEENVCARWDGHCPKNTHEKDTGCPIMETPTCRPDEKLCEQDAVLKTKLTAKPGDVFDRTATCALPAKCVPRRIKGSLCENPCKRQCIFQKQDGPGLVNKKHCKGPRDNKGCRADDVCLDTSKSCPPESFDEKGCTIWGAPDCSKDEETCPGLYERTGCQLQSTCIPEHSECSCPEQSNDNKGCPLKVNNEVCVAGQMSCEKKPDSLGCNMGTMCVPDKDSNQCQAICSLHCDTENKIECVATVSGPNNCPSTLVCLPKFMDKKSHCPTQCPSFCKKGFKECKQYTNKGCPKTNCIPSEAPCPQTYDENGCYINEEPKCTAEERVCPGGIDPDGCNNPKLCIDKTLPCPAPCDTRTQIACQKGTWDHVELGEFCVSASAYSKIWENVTCNTHCPVACDWKTQKACHGGFSKTTGCPVQDSCEGKDVPCATPAALSMRPLGPISSPEAK